MERCLAAWMLDCLEITERLTLLSDACVVGPTSSMAPSYLGQRALSCAQRNNVRFGDWRFAKTAAVFESEVAPRFCGCMLGAPTIIMVRW